MKKFMIAIALFCSAGQIYAHSSGASTPAQGCHKHAPNETAHCH